MTKEFEYDYAPESPLYEALQSIVGKNPPDFVVGIYAARELSDDQMTELQDWCATHGKPEWTTGIGILEAAERIVDCAVENGNIPPR